MPKPPDLFAFTLDPEILQRLNQLTTEVLQLLQEHTQGPEEALIVLDAVTRTLAAEFGIVLLAPILDSRVGHC
jgi:hypothetical protein